MNTNEIIKEAKGKYPVPIWYRGKLTQEDRKILEKYCYVNTLSVFMNGTGMYSIRYKGR